MSTGRNVWAAMVLLLALPWSARGERYALLIGVREYNADSLGPLKYTEDDVAELAQVLLASGYRSDNVRLLTQQAGATRARYLPLLSNIRKELALVLRDREPGDSVLIAFAGHGVQFRGGDAKYFCPMDAQVDDVRSLLPLDEVFGDLGRSGAGFKLLLVDACRNDPLAGVTRSTRPSAELESVSRPLLAPPPGGVAAFFSCSEGELAYEDPALKHGIFFHYVIEGLKGAAVAGDARDVALSDLEGYVKRRVDDHAKGRFGHRQMPELFNRSRGLFPIVVLDDGSIAERRAEVSMGRGQYARAVEEYSEALRARASATAYAGRSACRFYLGELDRGIADGDAALRLDPKLPLAYIARGMSLDASYQERRALDDFLAATRLAPESPVGWGFSSVNYQKLGDRARSLEAADRAIALPARDALDYLGRGDALHVRGDSEGAIRAADEVLRLGPNPLASNIRSNSYAQLGQLDRALADSNEMVQVTPGSPIAWANRGFVHLGKGDLARATSDFDAALARAPDFYFAHVGLGSVHRRKGAFDAAIAEFDKAVAGQPSIAAGRVHRANAFSARGEFDRALADAEEAIRLDPGLADAYCERSYARTSLGRHDPAIADADEAIRLAPKSPSGYLYRGFAYRAKKDPRADADFREAERLKAPAPR